MVTPTLIKMWAMESQLDEKTKSTNSLEFPPPKVTIPDKTFPFLLSEIY